MGGIGRGRWRRRDVKSLVEAFLQLDVRQWQREGLLRDGHGFAQCWWRGASLVGSVGVSVGALSVELVYRCRNADADGGALERDDDGAVTSQRVALARTGCHYGGQRTWFVCPGCDTRVAKLYLLSGHFRCRRCHRLVYASQRADRLDRQVARARQLRHRLGGEESIQQSLPPKPSRMRWSVYEHRLSLIESAESRVWQLLSDRLDRCCDGLGNRLATAKCAEAHEEAAHTHAFSPEDAPV